jgi:exonuclease III
MNVLGDDSGAESPHSQANPYPKLKGFSIGQLNIASLVKHIEELRIFITKTPFDILCIKTRLDNTIKSSEVEIQGYDLVRPHDRNRNGGGVAIYVRNVIPFSERKSLIPENVEAICLEIKKPKSKPIIISTWYRPPGLITQEYLTALKLFYRILITRTKKL